MYTVVIVDDERGHCKGWQKSLIGTTKVFLL